MAYSLETSLLSALECPVCDVYMSPPIRQCKKGHAFCQECFIKLEQCPICRSEKDPVARCWALEKMHATLEIPCRNSAAGCNFTCSGMNISSHQQECEFRTRPCPFREYDNCPWRNLTSTLAAHLASKHATNFYKKRWQMLVANDFKRISDYHFIYAVIYAFNEYFRITWDLDVRTGMFENLFFMIKGNSKILLNHVMRQCTSLFSLLFSFIVGMTRWAVYYLGSAERAPIFSFKLKFTVPEDNRTQHLPSMVLKSPCSAAPEDDAIKFIDHKYFFIHRRVLDGYCEDGNDLNYGVSIYCNNI